MKLRNRVSIGRRMKIPPTSQKGCLQTAGSVEESKNDDKNSEGPITDIQVIFTDRGEKPADGYTLIEKSVGGENADINRNVGGRCIYLTYSRDSSKEPISALSVIYDDVHENPPFGFRPIQLVD